MEDCSRMNVEIANNQQKYFMCEKCFRVVSGKFDSSISIYIPSEVYGDDELMDRRKLHIYNNTDNNVSIRCPYCDDDSTMFEIDKYMIDPIKYLNEKGYYTKFCCEGHITPAYAGMSELSAINDCLMVDSQPYIAFDWYEIANKLLVNAEDVRDTFIFFYYVRQHYTLFHNCFIQTKPGLLEAPEGWQPSIMHYGSDFQIDCIYYKGMDIGLNKDSSVLYELDEYFSKINSPVDNFEERYKNVQRAKEFISDERKKKIYEQDLIEWISKLPDLTKIHTKSEFIKAFNLSDG